MVREHAISHVGSLYGFSETAGRKIVSSFRTKSTSNTSCHFDGGNVFTLREFPGDDDSLASLLQSIKGSISVNKNQGPELLEDDDITRISGTHPSLTPAAWNKSRMQTLKPNGGVPAIEHGKIIRRWSPGSEHEGHRSELSPQLLGRIADLCGCRIEHASDSAELLIEADRERVIEQVISKLEQVNKMRVDEMSFPRIHSFYVLEGETSVDLQLTALKDLKDKRPFTTLLPKGSPVKSVRHLCVLDLVKSPGIVHVNIEPATSNQGFRLWKDHVSNYNQASGLIATKTAEEPNTPIDQWVSEVPDTDVQVDAFRPESTVEVQRSVDASMMYKGLLSPTKKPNTKRDRTARGNPNAFHEAFTEFRRGDKGNEVRKQGNVARSGDNPLAEIVSTGEEGESRCQPPSIEPPYMPSLPSSKTPSKTSWQPTPDLSTWTVVVRNSKSGDLIDASAPNEGCAKDKAMVVIDHLQDTTKGTARDLKRTMNQRKAPTQACFGGDTALVRNFEDTVTQLLVLALPRTGRIGLAVDIGRLLINQQYGLSEFKKRSFKTSEFSSVLPKGRPTDFEPIFTNILTARSSDAESIVNLRLSGGRRLFQQEPISRRVTYVFDCKAKGGDRVTVESDGKGDFRIQGTEILMGTLDWHFPKRAWDARLRLTSEGFLATDHEKQVKSVVENLRVDMSEDGQSLELWTKTIDDNLCIESITLRRETLHPVTLYPDLILHVTEYQDLQARQPDDSESIYTGSIQASKVMIRANRLWWGAKISSINAESILKENVTLKLGETATWNPSSITDKGVVRDLFAVATEVVKQIDHVGFFNRGEGRSNSKTTEKPSESSQQPPTRMSRVDPGYW